MKKSRLTSLFSSFKHDDWTNFSKYLKTNSKNNIEIQKIINYIRKQNIKTQIEFLDTEKIRKESKSTLGKQSFANAISTLCGDVERYLVQQEVENDSLLYESVLLKSLAKRGLSDNFYKKKNKIVTLKYKHDLWQDYYLFLTYHYEYFYNINNKKYESRQVVNQAFEKLKSFVANLSHFYSLEMHNRHVIIHEDWQDQINKANQLMVENTSLSNIFDQLVLLKISKRESAFIFLKQSLLMPEEVTSKEIQNAIYIHLCSFLNHKIKNGQTDRIPELLEMYELGFKKDIINFAGNISIRQFLTIVITACELKAFEWVEQFVDKWIESIDIHYRKEVLGLAKANLLFAKEKYKNVISILSSLKLKVFDHEYRVKWLVLMSLYEMNSQDIDIISREIRNFKYFIKKNGYRLEKTTFEAINNSLDLLNKIITNKLKDEDLELFGSNKPYIRQRWLYQKFQESSLKI